MGADGKKEFGRSASSRDRGSRDDSRGSYNKDNRSGSSDSRSGGGGYNRDNRSGSSDSRSGGGGYNRDNRSGGGGYNRDNRSGGGGYNRDNRSGGGGYNRDNRSEGGGYNRDNRSEGGGYNRDNRSGGGGYNRDNRSEGGGYNRDNRSGGGRYNRDNRSEGGGYNRDNRSGGGGYNRDNRSEGGGYNRDNRSGGGGYKRDNREQQDGGSYNSDNRDTRKDDGGYSREFRSRSGGLRHVTAEERALGSENIRLNRFIAHAGICSRREADKLIEDGMVTVNGVVVTEMGHKVNPTDEVKYAGEKLKAEKPVYLLMNKPKGFITTVEDEKARKTVMDLIGDACKERIYPVGRLDRATTGTLLFTNDGDLAKKLMHPSNGAPKIYLATLDKPLSPADLEAIKEGVTLNDGLVPVDKIEMPNADNHTLVGIEIHLGRNRIVRRLFEHLGYEVTKLDRTSFAGLTKKQLNRGQFRFLSEKEVGFLKMI
ncbi:MAG: pseudouridine synthase [Flavobacteriales bacterium]|nr:pseudouridine synthase [Flavobacteriales bacterium]